MRLVLTQDGNAERSAALFRYLMDYMDGLLAALLAKKSFTSAEVIEKEIAALRKQYRSAVAQGRFVSGWM